MLWHKDRQKVFYLPVVRLFATKLAKRLQPSTKKADIAAGFFNVIYWTIIQ